MSAKIFRIRIDIKLNFYTFAPYLYCVQRNKRKEKKIHETTGERFEKWPKKKKKKVRLFCKNKNDRQAAALCAVYPEGNSPHECRYSAG